MKSHDKYLKINNFRFEKFSDHGFYLHSIAFIDIPVSQKL
jgi:hypothetical protein